MYKVDNSGFKSGKAEIIRIFGRRSWQLILLCVALLCRSVDMHSAGILKAHCPCGFVKCLTCRIIGRLTYRFKLRIAVYLYYLAVSARNHKTQIRRLKFRVRYVVCRYMPLDMMHSDKRFVFCKRKPLCKVHPDKQCAYKPGCVRHRYCVDLVKRHIRLFKSLGTYSGYILTMSA